MQFRSSQEEGGMFVGCIYADEPVKWTVSNNTMELIDWDSGGG